MHPFPPLPSPSPLLRYLTGVEGEKRHVRVMLLAGSDLIATMSEPGVWSAVDVCAPGIVKGIC
jgi:hypothetical protein